jgi:hypothetical protein
VRPGSRSPEALTAVIVEPPYAAVARDYKDLEVAAVAVARPGCRHRPPERPPQIAAQGFAPDLPALRRRIPSVGVGLGRRRCNFRFGLDHASKPIFELSTQKAHTLDQRI